MSNKIYVDNIGMDKRTLRYYLGVQTIFQAKKLLGVPHYSTSKAYDLLDTLYRAERKAVALKEIQIRNDCFITLKKLNTIKENMKAKTNL